MERNEQHEPHHPDDRPDRPDESIGDIAARILEEAALAESRSYYLNRQFWLGLHDLGLLSLVGRDWATAHEESFSFGELDHRRMKHVVNRIHEIARIVAEHTPAQPAPPSGQREFRFEPRTVPVPVDTRHHHPAVGSYR